MKCLTYDETQAWLNSFDVKIGEHRHLSFAQPQDKLMITLPREPVRLHDFASRVNEWLPQNVSQLIWISNWETSPPDQFLLFEKLRAGCGEVRQLIESPGHLFEPAAPSTSEKAIANGIIFLILAFNWEGYLVAESCNDHIYLGDECLSFFSADDKKLKAATDMVQSFDLKIIADIKEAWRKE